MCLSAILLDTPLPARQSIEDMYWSFILAARAEPVVPLPLLDRSDVPSSARQQYLQLERWFLGPARALSYARDPQTPSGLPRVMLACGALALTAGWLFSAFTLPGLAYSALGPPGRTRSMMRIFLAIAYAEIVSAELMVGDGRITRRIARVILYPVSVTLFGAAGWSSIGRIVMAKPLRHKTVHASESAEAQQPRIV